MTGTTVKPIAQQSNRKKLSSQSTLRIVFLCCGFLTLLAAISGMIYTIHTVQLSNLLTQALQPLFFFVVALFLGILDVALWFPKSALVLSTQAENEEGNFVNTSSGERHVSPEHLLLPSPPQIDPNATIPVPPQFTPPFNTVKVLPQPAITEPISYSPIPERLQTFRYYILPREGKDLARCADKLSFDITRARYAVADGVGTSFLPGYWAQTIATEFVEHDINFTYPDDIVKWQQRCSERWHHWVNTEWVPQAVVESGQEDWSREIERGAATTFVGCSFLPAQLAQSGSTTISVAVVGDAEFFLLTPPRGQIGYWTCKERFNLQKSQDFGQTTETLATPERRLSRDYKWMRHTTYTAQHGDCIVLTTDALAQWTLQQMETGKNPWQELLSLSSEDAFRKLINRCRAAGEIEVDDTTIMIIPLDS
jgi:hypothetical protein